MLNLNGLTDAEKRVLTSALDTYTRLLMGQVDNVLDPLLMRNGLNGDVSDVEMANLAYLAKDMRETITGRVKNGYEPSIGNPLVPDEARIARRLQAMVTGDDVVLLLYNEDGVPVATR